MKKKIRSTSILNLLSLSLLLLAFASCKKDASLETDTTASVSQSVIAATQAIAVSARTSASGDSVYVVGTCAPHHHTDSIAFGSLPSAVSVYLAANYSGYIFQKAYTDKDSSGNIAGYVVIIQYNGKPVGLKFDASGVFVKVLEQREGRDLAGGHGFHQGGHFDDRDGMKRDTIALSALPAAITTYFASNYAQDTLVRAFKGKDSSIVVLSINNGAYATVFDANATFVKRAALPAHPGRPTSIAQDALPAATLTYLSTTYPNYVFKYAFAIKANRAVVGYAVFIDANATKYAIEFDASGNFLKAVTIR
ncbi:MAG: hypothetical protein JWQ09_5458 [Segetibacter sp.]|nr:hypothetical protein [Segetibacter sp.]